MMGLTIVVSPDASSASALPMLSELGVGEGGIFATAILIYLLAYLNVVEASEHDHSRLRSLLVAVSFPLLLAFIGIVAFESLIATGFL